MGFSDGNITVNEVASKNTNIPSSFNNIFKNAVNIRLLNTFSINLGYGGLGEWSHYHRPIYGGWSNQYPVWFPAGYNPTKWREIIVDDNGKYIRPWQWETVDDKDWRNDDFGYLIEIESFYYWLNPNTGEFKKETVTLDITPYIGKTLEEAYAQVGTGIDEGFGLRGCYWLDSINFSVVNNQIVLNMFLHNLLTEEKKYDSAPISNLPAEIQSWGNLPDENGFTLNSLCLPCDSADSAISKKLPCCLNGIFNEVATNTKFAFEIPSLAKIDNNGDISGLLSDYNNYGAEIHNYGDTNSYKKDYRNRNRSMSNLHVITLQKQLLVFRSELNPDVFDFDNELLRSVVS